MGLPAPLDATIGAGGTAWWARADAGEIVGHRPMLTDKSIRRGAFPSVEALIKAIREYLANYYADPTRFVWKPDVATNTPPRGPRNTGLQ